MNDEFAELGGPRGHAGVRLGGLGTWNAAW